MKKIIIAIAVFIVLVILGAGVFIATFNADRYRPFVVQKIEQAIGKKVTLGHLSLVWKNGIALEARDLKLYDASIQEKPLAELDKATAVVRLMPLLNKDVQIASIILLKPHVEVEYGPEGILAVAGIKPPTASGGSSNPASASSRMRLPVSIDLIQIKNGEVHFTGESGPTHLNLTVKDIDLEVKKFSFVRPLSFDLRMAVLSDKQNIFVNGSLQIPNASQAGFLKNFVLKTDLSSFDLAEIIKMLPQVSNAGLQEPLEGALQLNVEEINFNPEQMKLAKLGASLQNGKVSLKRFQTPIEHINLEAAVENKKIEIRDLSGHFAKGDFKVSGVLMHPRGQQDWTVNGAYRDADIQLLTPPAAQGRTGLMGKMSLEIGAQASGFQWPQISQSLTGQGRLTLNDGVLLNYNIMRVVVQKIANIPMIGEELLSHFPEQYKANLDEPSTILKPVDLPFSINNGMLIFQDLRLATEFFSINGAGSYFLNNTVNIKAVLLMNSTLSQALISASSPVQLLANNQGQIEIPLMVQGSIPNIQVLPDIDYLTSKIAAAKTQEVMTSLISKPGQGASALEKLLGKKAVSEDAAANTSNAVPDSSVNSNGQGSDVDKVNNFLKSFSKNK